ncbi:AraC family transcriptional regulator [Tichowtungia aerotolerans]|uniref:Helix-turn-helix domain-containing protein n=1 Tax=Tichowtungia aerotolerans TaxID=2697043 RepID=A0A6P1M7M3_9BACT|nr:AraC family transcriptional regulator [Tichowtungia aerotolerans]QHI70719.1 helix-turn-helix domain-containing protein [Tichowtungia aerotolerans]
MKLADRVSGFRIDDCVYPAGGTLGPRVQTSLQLFYVYSGYCDVFVDGREQRVGAGKIMLLLPNHVEQFRFARAEKTHHGFCSAYDAELSDRQLSDYQALTGVFPMSGKIRELTDWGKTLNVRTDASATNLYEQIAVLLFAEFFDSTGYPRQAVPLPEAVVRAQELIDSRYPESLDLACIARTGCVSPTHLIRLFKKYLGITPVEYLWRVRTENGRRLLVETGLNVSEIAYRCGFSAPYHFARRFRERYETSPRAFRVEQWTG